MTPSSLVRGTLSLVFSDIRFINIFVRDHSRSMPLNETGVCPKDDFGPLRRRNCEIYTMSQIKCANLFLSELRQIFTNFDNFWQKDGK